MTKKFVSPRRPLVIALAALALLTNAPAWSDDLLQVYREAQRSDPALASARASWEATQERVPQARSALLPNVALSASALQNDGRQVTQIDPVFSTSGSFRTYGYSFSASQPLYRAQYVIAYDQAREFVSQSDYVLAIAQQDLIVRTAVAYFDVLLAEFNVELSAQQKIAVDEQLAQAKRNFEVGTATITDTNEAQAKYDSIVAQEIVARNDLERRRTSLTAIVGRLPVSLKRVGRGFLPLPPEPNTLAYWVNRAQNENLSVRVARANYHIAVLEVDRARAGHYPTVDLVASFAQSGASGSLASDTDTQNRNAAIGVQLNVPLYQGGLVVSREREAISLKEKYRQDLETFRRAAISSAQDGFSGVNSAAALVRAQEQALQSAEVALQSNILGQEVGIRTNLDVLNVQQSVFTARRDLANAYFGYLLSVLRLKASVGNLTEIDLEDINRRLTG